MSKHLNDFVKGKVIALREEGYTLKAISEKLKIPISTISDVCGKYKSSGNILRTSGSGRKRILTALDTNKILSLIRREPKTTSKQLAKAINSKVSPRTIRRELNNFGLSGRVAVKKPLLSDKNRVLRKNFAMKNLGNDNNAWNRIIFSDECKFNLFGSDGRQYVWRKPNTALENKHLQPTVKFGGGSVMAWACFSGKGLGTLVFVDEKIDSKTYIDIISKNLTPSAKIMGLTSFVFQQDNAPAHKSKLTMEYFRVNGIDVIDWPAQSPDLNPIENLWAYIKYHLSFRNPKSLTELKKFIVEIWNSIPSELVIKVVNSMGRRCSNVIDMNGGHIDY